MNFLSGLALVLLSMVGYSSGSALAGRGRKIAPGILDLIVVIVLWILALMTRDLLGRGWALLVWLLVGLAVGALLMSLRRERFAKPKPWQVPPPVEGQGLRKVWNVWLRFSREMGDYQSRILLVLFYFLIVTPFALIVRLTSDPLHLHPKEGKSFWMEHAPIPTGVDDARRQF